MVNQQMLSVHVFRLIPLANMIDQYCWLLSTCVHFDSIYTIYTVASNGIYNLLVASLFFSNDMRLVRSASLPSAGATQESDLVGTICQKLDDLQSKHNFIKRDGTVIPIRQLESSLHEENGDRVTLFSEPEFSPTTSPLIEAKTPQVEEPHKICNDVLVCSSSRSRTSVASSASSVLTRSISSRSMSRSKSSHTASFSGLKKSTSSNLSLSSNEVDPLAFNGDFPDSGTMAVDCLANGLLEAYASGRQAKTESPFKLDQSGTAGASTSSEELVKKFVYTHYIKRTITEREYHRIVERATKKVRFAELQ